MKDFDITALGELLIDFTPAGLSAQGNICFERNPGGAPANVLTAMANLSSKTAFIGKVGDDIFGHYLKGVLESHSIATEGLMFSKESKTTLAFVQLDSRGDRSFSFYRNPGADTSLTPEEISRKLIESSKIFHFGSLSLTDEPAKSATLKALEYAKAAGCVISYDPNLRPPLWKNLDQAKEAIRSTLSWADILKISEEELLFLTGTDDLAAGTGKLTADYKIKVLLVTRGEKGCFYRWKGGTGEEPAFNTLKTIDTTGAGDAFLGGFLRSFLDAGSLDFANLDQKRLKKAVRFANAVAGLCTTKRGAIPAMPSAEEVRQLLG